MDADAARNRRGGTQHCRSRQRQHNRADAQKNALKPHLQKQWVIPPEANAAFVARMEDVLEVYQRPHDPDRPVVCLDETTKQLVKEIRVPISAKPGQPARHDYKYKRNGTANLFMMFAPLEGWRHVEVTDRHAALDYARSSRSCRTNTSSARARSCWCRTISARTSRLTLRSSPPQHRRLPSERSVAHTAKSMEPSWIST